MAGINDPMFYCSFNLQSVPNQPAFQKELARSCHEQGKANQEASKWTIFFFIYLTHSLLAFARRGAWRGTGGWFEVEEERF